MEKSSTFLFGFRSSQGFGLNTSAYESTVFMGMGNMRIRVCFLPFFHFNFPSLEISPVLFIIGLSLLFVKTVPALFNLFGTPMSDWYMI